MNEEQVEQLAQDIWSRRTTDETVAEIVAGYGFTDDEIVNLDWDMLPDEVKERIRDAARKEVSA